MKKKMILLIAAALILLPAAAFADGFWIGPTALYKDTLSFDEAVDSNWGEDVKAEDFDYGLDARLEMGMLEGSMLAFYDKWENWDIGFLSTFFDIGVSLNVALFDFGIGVGPNFLSLIVDDPDYETEPIQIGSNLKLSADLKLENVSVGAYFMYMLDDLSDIENIDDSTSGLVGLSALFRL
ncbi:MAG: hypothetical protein K9K78_06915 [Spirochaetales bacterium]|nr:hypothetical protein [Spirochaetales bacterium]